MRQLRNKPNVLAPTTDYPFGRAKDNPGDGSGTHVDENLLGDILQFFEKLVQDSGIPPNNLPDNFYSGFQLNQALAQIIANALANPAWIDVSTFGSNLGNATGTQAKTQYRKEANGRVWVRGTMAKSVASIPAASTTLLFTLPVGYRPNVELRIPIVATTVNGDNIFLWVKADGTVNIVTGSNIITVGTPIYLGEFTFSTDGSITP